MGSCNFFPFHNGNNLLKPHPIGLSVGHTKVTSCGSSHLTSIRRLQIVTTEKQNNRRLIVLFIIGSILLNYPLLSLFNHADEVMSGIPLLYFFVYVFWGLLILLAFVFTVRRTNNLSPRSGKEP